MTQNLLDCNGNVIGTIELPDGTSQDIVNAQVAMYALPPPSVPAVKIVSEAIDQAMVFGQQLITEFAANNVLAGITQANATKTVADYCVNLAYYLNSGSLYAAINEINTMIADTSSTKTACAPFITNDILYNYLNQIQTFLQLPLTANPGS